MEERQGCEKPPLGRPRSGTVGAGPTLGPKRVGAAGYHSEGYFSSDQDEETPKRAGKEHSLSSCNSFGVS